MQTLQYLIFFAHENMKKPPSKVAHNRPNFFCSIANRSKTSPNLNFCSPYLVTLVTSLKFYQLIDFFFCFSKMNFCIHVILNHIYTNSTTPNRLCYKSSRPDGFQPNDEIYKETISRSSNSGLKFEYNLAQIMSHNDLKLLK